MAGRCILVLLCALLLAPRLLQAHEFWLTPAEWQVQDAGSTAVRLWVGTDMDGRELPHLDGATAELDGPGGVLQPRPGATPALLLGDLAPGLHVVRYRTTPRTARFAGMDDFAEYLAYEGLDHLVAEHRRRGLPEVGFSESYSRFAKTLVQAGPVEGDHTDRAADWPLELVALDPPYAANATRLRVQLLRDGQPLADYPVAVLRDQPTATRRLLTTDANGIVQVDPRGQGTLLLNAVDLVPVSLGDTVWHSNWASLTLGLQGVDTAHPLDPLSADEIMLAIRAIGRSGVANRDTRAVHVTLAEADKAAVLAWQPGAPVERRAEVVIRNGQRQHRAIVDLASGGIVTAEDLPDGVQAPLHSAEWARAQDLLRGDPRWLAAMARRGLDTPEDLFCEVLPAGPVPEQAPGRRLVVMPCYLAEDATINPYARPVEGVLAVVDLAADQVLRVEDGPVVPVAEGHGEVPVLPAAQPQPAEQPFRLQGHQVFWNEWSFHLGFDVRFGPVLSLVRRHDSGEPRLVLYQGHLSEVFVPYMDQDPAWRYRAFLDAGSFGLGQLASPLHPGVDCPATAQFIDATLVRPEGAPYRRQRVLCVFERVDDRPLWRHWEGLTGATAGTLARELVVRAVASVGNYDYLQDWVFTSAGEVRIDIGATGIDAVKGVPVKSMADPGAAAHTDSGMLVAPGLLAVHHDHYFSVRLDLDVDGPRNQMVTERLVQEAVADGSARRGRWRLQPEPVLAEGPQSGGPMDRLWRVGHADKRTALGHAPAYQVVGSANARSKLPEGDWAQQRGAFAANTLWVTVYRPGERAAAGDWPLSGTAGQGLPTWAAGEPVDGADVVLWYTLGFHHLTRPEDWPVLPVMWHSLRLRPYGFIHTEKSPD